MSETNLNFGGHIERLKRFEINFKKSPKARLTQSHLSTRLNVLKELWGEYKNIYSEIVRADKLQEIDIDAYSAGEEQFIQLLGEITEMIAKHTPETVNPPPTTVPQGSKSEIKLPRINLSTFSGDYLTWTSFRDLFNTLVHENKSISNVEKLHYLKTNLSGEAEQLLRNIQVTDANYEDAWNTLVNRYDNKRMIVYHHFKCLTSQPNLHAESSAAIKKLLDTTSETLRALNNIGLPTKHWDDWVVYLIVQKLDVESLKQWEMANASSIDLPTWENLRLFLQDRFRILEAITPCKPKADKKRFSEPSLRTFHTTAMSCVLCQKSHPLFSCFRFQKMKIEERRKFVRDNQLCSNCLRSDHLSNECRNTKRCSVCSQKHHSMVHETSKSTPVDDNSRNSTSQDARPQIGEATSGSSIKVVSAHVTPTNSTVLLATALIRVKSAFGPQMTLRALLDQGSQATFITEKAANRLGLRRASMMIPIIGVGSVTTNTTSSIVRLEIQSNIDSEFKISTNALVIKVITAHLPSEPMATSTWDHISNIKLADPLYFKPSGIDILLGADIFGELLLDGLIKGHNGQPIAQNTTLGWILSGKTGLLSKRSSVTTGILNLHTCIDVSNQLKSFWEIEELSNRVHSAEERKCEEYYLETHKRSPDGKYIVNLPFIDFRPNETTFGNSRNGAIAMLLSIEKRFQKNNHLREEYTKFMKDYLDQHHMEIVSDPYTNMNRAFYMAHHPVFKQSSTTTKLRVVFDGSRKSSNGVSLNDTLMVGPTIQPELISIIMNWRVHKIAFTADIKQMYRQIKLNPNDTDYQRIVWRFNPDEPITDYRLNTVTYGTSSAPYLAIKTLMQLAFDERHNFPLAAESIQHEMYVDDVMSGGDSIEAALKLQSELRSLLESGGFELRKWSSNHADILRAVPSEFHDPKSVLDIYNDGLVKTLGIFWNPTKDEFGYNISLSNEPKITKRIILAEVSRLFDPLGWVSPCIITPKIMLQNLWLAHINWDDPVPESIQRSWLTYRSELTSLSRIKIPRWLNTISNKHCELHGFCDASNVAYAAAIYSRSLGSDGTYHIGLIAAKTRVAPVKQVSIPRLELCGAVLLAKLFRKITSIKPYQQCTMHAWTDSTVVLCWLKGHPNRWKPFIANRVSEIHNVNISHWRHVPTESNPADCASRGLSPTLLETHTLWWNGPSWLRQHSSQWPNQQPIQNQNIDLEERKPVISTMCRNDSWNFIHKYSCLTKLVRITAYIRRFLHNVSTHTKINKKCGFLSADELKSALTFWLKYEQQIHFQKEIKCCTKQLPVKGALASLNPLLDEESVLRVGGRLQNSCLPYAAKHPVILPRNSPISLMIVAQAHINTLHGGITQTLGYTRRDYWIIHGRNLVRQYVHKCTTCFRYTAETRSQLMGNLPYPRVNQSRPFQHSGVDYAGPILLRMSKGRGSKAYKGYICVFVCLCTKAIHLEIVSDLTTIAFISAFKRLTSRRGKISDLYSDNGTTFVGASAELQRNHMKAMTQLQSDITEHLANDGVTWHFIPPSSPHFGGLWEAGVKSVKYHLRRIIGETKLTYEEMSTVLIQIEGALNSRPLCPITNDPEDLTILTPGHFLIGDAINSVPEPTMLDFKQNYCSRWQLTQRIYQHFWQRWSTDYLTRLQQRPKWMQQKADIHIGDLVLLKEDNLPPSKWLLARITEKHPGSDGITRVVTLKTKTKYMRRPITKICPLPIDTADESVDAIAAAK